MRRPTLYLLSLLAPAPALAMLHCEDVRIDGHSFNLKALGGPHSVVTTRLENAQTHINTTYTVDICQPLKKSGNKKKNEECPNGTRVCAISRFLKGDLDEVDQVRAIAGSLENNGGSAFEYKATRLKKTDSNSDVQKEGVRLVLKGGKSPLTGPVRERKEQRAVIEFLCDPEREGTEGEWDSEDKYDRVRRSEKREDDKKKDGDDDKEKDGDGEGGDDEDGDGGESSREHQLKSKNSALVWQSYGDEEGADVLRMTWYTKHACEKREDSGDDDSGDSTGSSHWGFFTWFVVIVFLGTAAYLIFGSWLNYNRYGARGWDLLPHGDTIRDIPYLMKDWTRRVLNTVQGTGSRGGYSAV